MREMTSVYGMKKMGVLVHDVKQVDLVQKFHMENTNYEVYFHLYHSLNFSTFDHNESFIVMMNEYTPHLFILFLAISTMNTTD
jgi:hypothetical protein